MMMSDESKKYRGTLSESNDANRIDANQKVQGEPYANRMMRIELMRIIKYRGDPMRIE